MDKFIYETKFPVDVCDGIIDFYNTSDQFQKHPGQISNREDTAKSDKDSIDLSIPWHFIEFDQLFQKPLMNITARLFAKNTYLYIS